MKEILFDWKPAPPPCSTISAFLDYLVDAVHPDELIGTGLPLDPYREMLPDDGPITFTHNDLHRRNIMVSAPEDGEPRVLALVDWHQSGWLPPFWEWCKAYWCVSPDDDWVQYLHIFLEPFPAYDHWSYFATCLGM